MAETQDLYLSDPKYLATPLVSPVPLPRLTPPREHRSCGGKRDDARDGRGGRDGRDASRQVERPPTPVYRDDITIPHQQAVQWLTCALPLDDTTWVDVLACTVEPVKELDYSLFCMKEIVNQLYETKVKVHDLTPQALHYARSRANPYELVGRSIFVNRSAVKMANLDALCQFLDRARERCANGEFRFVDLCSGPGGFTEYILWRTKQMGLQAKGWGMTLKGEQDFALEKMDPAIDVPNRFQPFYGADQTGDVYRTANIKAFVDLVEAGSQTEGVDLVTCDGGFNVTGDEWNQEDHSRQILLCQVLIGLSVLREHGDFLFKVFDLYTPFMVELVYILYRMFEKIAIVKPFTSRPANSERYIVCRSLRAKPNAQVLQHLFGVNDKFNELKGDDAAKPIISSHATQQPGFLPREEKIKNGLTEVVHIVDPEIVMKEKGLIGPIKSQNMRLTMWQKEALEELYKYANDKARPEYDQEGIRRRCLQEWKLPIPQASRRPPPDTPYGRDRNNDGRYQSSAHNNRFSPYSRNGGNDRGRNGDGDRNRDRDRRQDDPYRHGHRDHGQAQAHRRY